jgi:hypothetical protein
VHAGAFRHHFQCARLGDVLHIELFRLARAADGGFLHELLTVVVQLPEGLDPAVHCIRNVTLGVSAHEVSQELGRMSAHNLQRIIVIHDRFRCLNELHVQGCKVLGPLLCPYDTLQWRNQFEGPEEFEEFVYLRVGFGDGVKERAHRLAECLEGKGPARFTTSVDPKRVN